MLQTQIGLVKFYFQLQDLGFKTIDALDGCEAMLEKAKEKDVYQNLFCATLGPNRLNIEDSKAPFESNDSGQYTTV